MEKRMLKKVLAIMCIIALTLPTFLSVTLAADSTEETKSFGITKTTDNGIGYRVQTTKNGSTVTTNTYRIYISENGAKNYNKGVFCLDSSKSFPSETTTEYNKTGNYTEKEEILKIADNMYLPSQTAEEKDAILNKIFKEKIEEDVVPPTTLEMIKELVSEDDIYFAEQCAIWHYTNNFEWSNAGIEYTQDNWQHTLEPSSSTEINSKFTLMKVIYDYFTEKNSSLSRETSSLTDISLTKASKETITLSDGYAVGPFKVNSGTNTNNTIKLYSQNDTEITTYTLVDKNGNLLGNNVNSLIGTDFYVKVTDTNTIKKIVLKITSTQNKTTKTLWNATTGDYQPLLLINKEPVTISDQDEATIVIPEKKIYDLALRKYITKFGDTDIETRIPSIGYDESDSNKITYSHPKDPIELKVGDKVVYTITVYNEGENDAKPTKIIDYLPEGLEYVRSSESEINTEYGWQISNDGTYAITAYTASKEDLKSFDKDNMKIDAISLKIECRVKEDVPTGKVLTNIAEIAEDNIAIRDEDNTDIDSTPYNLVKPGDVENYKGKSTNPSDLTKTDFYYRGQEDDDDFEKVIVKSEDIEELDIALRKYITTINGESKDREPEVDVTPLKEGTSTTATYTHSKEPILVKQGDIVIYSIRLYNEMNNDVYADEVTDYLPEGLGFLIGHTINVENGWRIEDNSNINPVKLNTIPKAVENSTKSDYTGIESLNDVEVAVGKVNIKTNKLQYTEGGNDKVIKGFNKDTDTTLDYETLQVACVVTASNLSNDIIKNIAAVTDESNKNGQKVNNTTIKDRDSQPQEIDLTSYPDNTNIQDDDDFEKLILKQNYDLALKKFITSVEGNDVPSRLKSVNTTPLVNGETDAEYEMDKTIVKLKTGNKVVYTIKIFNEGDTDAIVGEIVDTLPEGLEFIENSQINEEYGWTKFNSASVEGGWEEGIKTDYLKDTTIKAFDKTANEIDSKEIQVELKVVEEDAVPIKNIAEITKDDGDDRDSTPNNKDEKEDDEDYDTVIPVIFDLALRKFITGINETEVTDRIPELSIDNNYEITYNHTKEPMSVADGNIVTYTIRMYNEGNQDGYIQEVKDDIPEGLIFLPNDELNKKYGWVEENGEIRTDYLSKEKSEQRGEDNLLKAFDRELGLTNDNPDYRDVKVNFKVDQSKLDSLDTIIINTAEITKHSDKDGNDVTDKDSTPDNNKSGEDDIDKEYIKLQYFDLALVKYTSTVVVKEDGKVKTIQTGHDGTENPEPAVKVEINRKKLNTTEVTFIFTIKVTNQGQLEGYATEIKDRIPAGLSFYKQDNPNWEISEDGVVVTNALADTLLKPGESANVTIALRWDKSESNLGTKINTAEISKDKNKYNAPDIDSTPDNNKEGEDDQDTAPVLLSIKTGIEQSHIILIITIITIMSAGIYSIKKFVL